MLHAPWPHRTPLYFTARIRELEARHAQLPLMARAGEAAARLARHLVADNGKPILIAAGPGNNGGDAFVAARLLKQWFHAVTVVFAHDAATLPTDARAAYQAWRDAGGVIQSAWPTQGDWALVIDGLFGIGLKRAIDGQYAQWIHAINATPAPVLAIDIPSGLDADTGAVHGVAIRATHTLTFLALKPGLLTLDGADHAGTVSVDTLGIADEGTAGGYTLGHGVIAEALKPRTLNSHKGTHGSAGIIGGADGMTGAVLLSGRAALKAGAGRVYVGMLANNAPTLDMVQPELMLRRAEEVLDLPQLSCLALGPGLGQSDAAKACLSRALQLPLPLVLDADALNLLALDDLKKILRNPSRNNIVLTPHPAEAARLLGVTTRDIQADRIAATCRMAREFNAHVVLKGMGSVCAAPDGAWCINSSGNPGMASAGMGDVLTGLIAALLAQGTPAREALHAAVWLHGAAADACVKGGAGPVGLTAGETIDAARRVLNDA
jgi:hydroxyethylthiazole kinase-like uncharacterized protein yjeF